MMLWCRLRSLLICSLKCLRYPCHGQEFYRMASQTSLIRMLYDTIVINEIIANGMTPMVTMTGFDWDLRLNLQLLRGCTNPILVK